MQNWKDLVTKAKEDALRIYPKMAEAKPEWKARQDRIDDVTFALEVNPHDVKLLAELIQLNRERAHDALTFEE